MMIFLKKFKFKIMFVALGALAGLSYWHFIGCTSGTCPITSHWYTSSGYGMIFGWLIGDLVKKDKKTSIDHES